MNKKDALIASFFMCGRTRQDSDIRLAQAALIFQLQSLSTGFDMEFRIAGLAPQLFASLFSMNDDQLAAHKAVRRVVDKNFSFPCRVSFDDAAPGETVMLLNYQHQAAKTPFQASHAIYVRESIKRAFDAVNEVPPALRRRVISLRAFDTNGWLIAADLAEGKELESCISGLLTNRAAAYLHAHYAKMGCFAARIDRAGSEHDNKDAGVLLSG